MVDLRGSAPDVILTTANKIQHRGWKRGEPWIQEVTRSRRAALGADRPHQQAAAVAMGANGASPTATARRWRTTGCRPALVLPMGRKGPAFLTYDNYDIYLEWNQSFIYTLTAAHLATRLAGAPPFEPRNPGAGLSARA